MKRKIIVYIFLFVVTGNVLSNNALPLDTILKRTMSASLKYNQLIEHFDAEVYMRTYVQTVKKNILYKYTHLIPNFVLHDPYADETLIETFSDFKFDYPNNYKQDIKYVNGTLTRKKDIDLMPFNFLNINVYGETTNNESFFMPTNFSTSKYYKYDLVQTYEEGGKRYYTIDFDPVYKNPKLLKGRFIVEYGTWRITYFKGEGIDILTDFTFEITMGNRWVTNYLPEKISIFHVAKYLGNKIASRHLAEISYKDIDLRKVKETKKTLNLSNFHKIKVNLVPIISDSVFWNEKRPIPLQAIEKDVMDAFLAKQAQKRIPNTTNNKISTKRLAQGIITNTRYKYKSTSIDYSGLFNPLMLGYSSQDGISYRQKVYFNFDMQKSRTFKINAFAGYISKRKDFQANITTTWNYEPFYLGSVSLSTGIGSPLYSYVSNADEKKSKVIFSFDEIDSNSFKDYYIKLTNNYEIANGLLTTIGVDYHYRKPSSYTINQQLTENGQIYNEIFEDSKAFIPFIRLSWTPEQYYRYESRQKIYVRSRYPTFKVEFSRSFERIFGSNSQFNRVEMDINQNISIGHMNSIQYHVGAGRFFDRKTYHFTDFYYFSKNFFPENWKDGIGGGFNLLRPHLYNLSDSYIQAHFMFETPFLILKRIPIVQQFADKERLYVSQLYTPQIISYTEIGYGIGNRFFNAAIFGSFHKIRFREIGAKASFEI